MATTCPVCSAAVEPTDRFCWSCGAHLTLDCITCGASLRADSQFCPSCGTPVRTATRVVEHRLVTALYIDLVGSTALAEQLDPEHLATVVGALHAAVRTEVGERQGSVGAFIGDGVLGVFGLPAAHEDDPERAIRAAQGILRRYEEVDRTLGARFDVSLAARIGINTGDLLAPASDEPELGTLAGDVLNVAARLQEIAGAGNIVVSERTARSAPGFRFDDLGVIDVRGRARPVHAFRVSGEAEERPFALTGPFLGRAEALGTLRGTFTRVVAEGRPAHVAVIGDAGVGKSRLVREFVDWAAAVDPTLTSLTGRCLPYGEDVVFRPLTEILVEVTGITAGTDPDQARARLEHLIPTGSVPEEEDAIAVLLRTAGVRTGASDATSSPRRTRELLRSAWTSLLSAVANDGPAVIVIEDVHWAGDALFDLLDHVVRRAEGPLLVLTPARPEVFDRHPDWVADGARTVVVPVPPLEADDARRLAGRLLADARLPVREAEAVAGRADGNPFFMEELVRQLALRGDDTGHEHTAELPATIQGVISARIDLLGTRDRRVLQAASIMGRIFWPSAVAHVTGFDEADVAESLAHLETMQMVRANLRATKHGEPEFLFQHSLIGETAYGRLSRIDLARLHGSLAEWLERLDDARRPDIAERLAYHTARAHAAAEATDGFDSAEVSRLRALAVDRLLLASVRSRERAAFGRSRELAMNALEIAGGAAEAWRAHEQLGMTHLAESEGDAAWEAFTTALATHQRLDDPDPAVVARLAAAAVESPLRWTGTVRQKPTLAEVQRIIGVGLDHAGTGDSESLAMLLVAIAFIPMSLATPEDTEVSWDDARSAALRAREIARRLDLPHAESAALDALMNLAMATGRIQQAAALINERLAIVDAIADPREIGDTYAMAAALSFELGDYVEARTRADKGVARTLDDSPSVALRSLSWAVQARVQTGEWADVATEVQRAHELLDLERRPLPPLLVSRLFAAAAMTAEFQGRRKEADRLLHLLETGWAASDLPGIDPHPHSRWCKFVGPILLRRGRFDEVAAMVSPTGLVSFGHEGGRLGVLCDLVAATGAWDRADDVVAEARTVGNAYGLLPLTAFADRLEGRASFAVGDRRGGRALLQSAEERFLAMGARWEAARTALDLAEAEGGGHAAWAADLFATIGAVDEITRAERWITAPEAADA